MLQIGKKKSTPVFVGFRQNNFKEMTGNYDNDCLRNQKKNVRSRWVAYLACPCLDLALNTMAVEDIG